MTIKCSLLYIIEEPITWIYITLMQLKEKLSMIIYHNSLDVFFLIDFPLVPSKLNHVSAGELENIWKMSRAATGRAVFWHNALLNLWVIWWQIIHCSQYCMYLLLSSVPAQLSSDRYCLCLVIDRVTTINFSDSG